MNDIIFTIRQVCDGLEIYADDELSVYLENRIAELRTYCSAYDALAPDWSQAPEWAKWATMYENGKTFFWEFDPEIGFFDSEWIWMEKCQKIGKTLSVMRSPLPVGIDWRLLKWQRPEVAA